MSKDKLDDGNAFFIDHLKDSYERQWKIRENIESKSNNAIRTTGIIFAILFGFLSATDYPDDWGTRCLLFLGLISSIASIIGGFFSLVIGRFTSVLYDKKGIQDVSKMDHESMMEILIQNYTDGIKDLSDKNTIKAYFALACQICMVVGIILLMLSVINIVTNLPTN